MTYVSTRANPFAYRPDTPIDLPAGRLYHASARSMDLLVSFHSQCKGMKYYELRSAGAEWGTKLKLVKESTTPPQSTVCRGLGPWDTQWERHRWSSTSEKNRSNSKTRNTPWYPCATEWLIIFLVRIIDMLWILLTTSRMIVNVINTSKTVISIAQQIHRFRSYKSWFYVRWNELCMQVYKKIYSFCCVAL